ncbi:hypothetical protein EW145_g3323 [Phellinidium pouzarii]|uniref:Uncharacterized protein n=1 Tax=Phellinidium pouzarii TaxID=167371 RepID=A0A4V3XCX5_9AGAM|nr:hypothetical protein EW145_g3323 [Phellinidium pouzarii]
MVSLDVEQPTAAPAVEWATTTTDGVPIESSQSKPLAPAFTTPTGQETPGLDIPGAFPRSYSSHNTNDPDAHTPHAAVARLADAASPNDFGSLTGIDVGKHLDNAKSYIPARENMRDTARTYLPNFTGAFGLSANTTDSETEPVETQLDLTSTAKPNVASELSGEDTNSDDGSTVAIPPSTRSPSYQIDLPDVSGKATEPVRVDASLDPTSAAKPYSSYTNLDTSARNEAPTAVAAAATTAAQPPVQLPTPPESDSSTDRAAPLPVVPGKDESHAASDTTPAKREASEASTDSTDSTSSPGKKEGRARRLVERMKDKLHHRPAGH